MMQPPTDSLYKFMAVLGIVLSMGSIAFADSHFQKYNSALVSMNSQVRMHKHESENLSSDLADFTRTHLELISQSELSGQPISRRSLDEFKSELDKFVLANREMSTKNAGDAIKLMEIIHTRRIMHYYLIACAGGLLAGLVITIIGFRLWYRKVQVPEDRKNLSQTTKASKR
ncbi:hypothetical protein HGQ62_15610 [Stenotrophomonas maltophilia]|nr:hypothetical protein [Stenotrophomonas maltophilia]